ncbi:hypothetical protein E0485_23430 [Paenibacillus albiflavus]|uniref:Uncharacterized protein n=1 Tax=Paenibacillus albiflavus TaxID=2545760 RepID=A0A4V2WMK1_9BACL|nr:hypothetical protein [Paenibacillus albiflavus]TCZ70222.1 hypothetical protein E0485_23430 [Paenibacillus albiflavus]
MKKIISGAILLFIFVIIVSLYLTQWSISANLKKQSFTKKDIISVEGYSKDAEHLTQIYLLADSNKIGIVGLTDQGFGIWKDEQLGWVITNPKFEEFATSSMSIHKNRGINGYIETHIFVAAYLDNDVKPQITGNSDFYLNVDYYTVNNKVLLFAHAIAGRNVSGFGTTEVIDYLMSRLNTQMK